MHTLNIASALKNMTVDELKDFVLENYCKGTAFVKESSYYLMEQLKKRFVIVCNQINRKNT